MQQALLLYPELLGNLHLGRKANFSTVYLNFSSTTFSSLYLAYLFVRSFGRAANLSVDLHCFALAQLKHSPGFGLPGV